MRQAVVGILGEHFGRRGVNPALSERAGAGDGREAVLAESVDGILPPEGPVVCTEFPGNVERGFVYRTLAMRGNPQAVRLNGEAHGHVVEGLGARIVPAAVQLIGNNGYGVVLDELLYRERYSIERTNAWMDSFRTILNRFDTTLRNWESWNYIAFSVMLLRKCARKRKV